MILLSLRIRPYERLAKAIEARLKGYETQVLYLSEEPAWKIRQFKPSAIVTVGQDALKKALAHRGTAPIVYTMVLFPKQVLQSSPEEVSGIAMLPSPRQNLLILQKGLHLKRLATYCNPDVSGDLLRSIAEMSPGGIECSAYPVRSEAELLKSLDAGLPDADGILLIPDPAVLSEQSLKKLIGACYARKVPLIGFSPMYLDLGAAASISLSEEEIAKKAVALVVNGSDGDSDQVGDLHYLRPCVIHLNKVAEQKLGLQVDRTALRQLGSLVEGGT